MDTDANVQELDIRMLVLQINKKGYFMSKLLSGADFDLFLLTQATLKTDVTWQIDGRINAAFAKAQAENTMNAETADKAPDAGGSSASLTADPFIPWQDIRERLRELIRGKTAPELMRFQLMLKPGAAAGTGPALPEGYHYLMRIDFDGTELRVMTTAEPASAELFMPSGRREALSAWDSYAAGFLNALGIDWTEL